jgi:hypothetical protein
MTILNADRWLTTKLTGDATIAAVLGSRIYSDIASQSNTQYPYAIIENVSQVMDANLSADRIMDDELWQVRVVTQSAAYDGLETVVDRIRTVLHQASGTGVIGCVYEGAQRMTDIEAGQMYKTIVLEFRLFTQ